MKLLYVSDHRFIRKKNGEVYTTGKMSESYFDRFRESFEYVTVIGLCEEENHSNIRKIVEKVDLNSPFVRYVLVKSKGSVLGRFNGIKIIKERYIKLLKKHDRVAIKAPTLILGAVVRTTKRHNVPLLVELVGCPWDALWNHSFKGKLIAPYMWSLTRRAVKNTPFVLYVTKKFLQSRYPCKGKIISCSDVELPSLDVNVLERRLETIKNFSPNESIILGTIAAVNVKYKGQEFVIRAISKLNKEGHNFEYHLLGGGDSSYLKTVAKEHGVLDKVKFLGALPHDKVFDFLENIDIYIQPSKTEGLPRALVEAMSRGCPSCGSRVGGIPELINRELIFNSGSVDEIYAVFKKIDKKRMLEEAVRSFEMAKEFDKKLLDKKRLAFYKEFIECGENR